MRAQHESTEPAGQGYPGEVQVSEQKIPAHTIRATATPRAVVLMLGMLDLRRPRHGKPCEVTYNGGALWRLSGGFVVSLEFDDNGSATWHLDIEDVDPEPRDD